VGVAEVIANVLLVGVVGMEVFCVKYVNTPVTGGAIPPDSTAIKAPPYWSTDDIGITEPLIKVVLFGTAVTTCNR
jgi:hypothetical protein